MTTATLARRDVLVTGVRTPVQVPAWARGCGARTMEPGEFTRSSEFPDITIVRGQRPDRLLARTALLERLAVVQARSRRPAVVLLEFIASAGRDPDELAGLLRGFSDPLRVEMAWGPEGGAAAFVEAVAKLTAAEERIERDPLGEVPGIVAATAGLRAESGRLSAKRVAAAFGISSAELAEKILGRSRQAVSKTDDAESLQQALRPFEKVARLLAVLDPADFLKWLRMPNAQLEDDSPLDLIRGGKVRIIADLAHDMLVGNPT